VVLAAILTVLLLRYWLWLRDRVLEVIVSPNGLTFRTRVRGEWLVEWNKPGLKIHLTDGSAMKPGFGSYALVPCSIVLGRVQAGISFDAFRAIQSAAHAAGLPSLELPLGPPGRIILIGAFKHVADKRPFT
jgi:hypothetical protein